MIKSAACVVLRKKHIMNKKKAYFFVNGVSSREDAPENMVNDF
jgi:hypothetical protein